MKKSLFIETIIFIFLISILVFLGVKTIKHTFDIGTTYHLVFHDIDGIGIGSPVRILGVDIGHVTKIRSNYDEIYVDFVVTDENVKIPDGTKATIVFFGIAGSRSIALTPPDGKTDEQGIIVSEPIRIGDALGIMSKFIRATMVSIGGLYEFAKGRTLEETEATTSGLVTGMDVASKNLDTVTSSIDNTSSTLHTTMNNTNRGFNRVYTETSNLNINQNFPKVKYAVNLLKRSLIQGNREVVKLHEPEKYNRIINKTSNIAANVTSCTTKIEQLSSKTIALEKALSGLNSNFTQEKLDEVYRILENLKCTTANLEKNI